MEAVVKRTYKGLDLTFGALPVGYVRKNLPEVARLGVGTATFQQIVDAMPIVHKSIALGMGSKAPSEEAVEDVIDLLDVQDAMLAVLEASGFSIVKQPTGETPGEDSAAKA